MKRKLYFMLLSILLLIPNIVYAAEDKDVTKCFYTIKVPGYGETFGKDEDFEFVVKIGDSNNKTAQCKLYFDSKTLFNDSWYGRKNCDDLYDSKGKGNPQDYIRACQYYDCWSSNKGDEPYNNYFNYMYDIRNNRYVNFHYGKEFYEQYYLSGGKCPELYGEINNDEVFQIRLGQQDASDYGPFYPKNKLVVKDGKSEKKDPNSTDVEMTTKSCEYQFQAKVPAGQQYKIKMKIEKETNQETGTSNYNVRLIDSSNCDPIDLKSIQTMNNGGWQEYIGSSNMTATIKVDENTMKKLIDGNSCVSNSNLVATYKNSIVTLDIDENASSYVNFSDFCVSKTDTNKVVEPTNISELNCTSLLGNPSDSSTPSPAFLLTYAFKIIRYIAIILLVVLSIMDFVSATASQDADSIKKAISKVIKRMIMCVIIFLLPSLIELILTIIYNKAVNICINT